MSISRPTAGAIRALLADRFPDAVSMADEEARRTAGPVPLGVAGLEHVFPAGGLPRGRLTAWLSQGGGATAILRAACHATIATGERAAWIDGLGILGPGWISEMDGAGASSPLIVRPSGPADSRLHALRWAEGLLRSGGFALVVVAGVEPRGTEPVRLARAAHDGGGACVALTSFAAMATLRVTSRVLPTGYHCSPSPFPDPAAVAMATIEVRVRTPGWNQCAQVTFPITPYELRLTLGHDSPDRRGVAR